LHLAAQEGHPSVLQFLLDSGAEFKKNKDDYYFIELAIKKKQNEALMAIISHDRWEEALDLDSKEFKTPFIGIIKMSSEITQAVMERCVTAHYYEDSCNKKYSVSRFNKLYY
jgi:hypothetical protein